MDAETAPRAFQTSGRIWLKDFDFRLNGLKVRKTGAWVPYSPDILNQVWAWFRFFARVQAIRPASPSFTIAFTPERARPWYLIWAVTRVAGAKVVQDLARADVVVHFEDSTYSPNPTPTHLKPGARLLNFRCRDISKSNVERVFGEAFGYPLAVDPSQHVGPAVEKNEINAAHDGRIVQCPTRALPGRTYQRLIDSRAFNPALVEDLRTCMVGGKPGCVFIKRRPIAKRFLNTNCEVLLARPEDVFSAAEIARIEIFADRLGVEWGGLDVLRDRADGRLYIVDANKTDLGPPIAMRLKDKIRTVHVLAEAFRAYLQRTAH